MTVSPMNWQFTISRDYLRLEHLSDAQVFRDINILVDNDDELGRAFYLTSSHFACLSNDVEVWKRAHSLMCLLSGSLELNGLEYPFELGQLFDASSDTIYNRPESFRTLESAFDTNLVQAECTLENYNLTKTSRAAHFIYLSRYDPLVNSLLRFVGENGLNWVTLYAIMEFCKYAEWDNDKINSIGKESSEDPNWLRRFTRVANSFETIGPLSRHGPNNNGVPAPNPMDLSQARIHLKKCALALLKERSEKLYEGLVR